MGFKPTTRDLRRETKVAAGFALAGFLVLAIAVPLCLRGFTDLRDLHDKIVAARVIDEWLGKHDVRLVDLEVEDSIFRADFLINIPVEALEQPLTPSLVGHIDPELTVESLKKRIEAALDKPVEVIVTGTFGFVDSTCPECLRRDFEKARALDRLPAEDEENK